MQLYCSVFLTFYLKMLNKVYHKSLRYNFPLECYHYTVEPTLSLPYRHFELFPGLIFLTEHD